MTTRRKTKKKGETITTGQVCDLLGLTDRRVQDVLRGMPRDQRPRIAAGKRTWTPADVETLRARLDELGGGR